MVGSPFLGMGDQTGNAAMDLGLTGKSAAQGQTDDELDKQKKKMKTTGQYSPLGSLGVYSLLGL